MAEDSSAEAALEDFEYLLADMDDALERFLAAVPPELAARLDYSAPSLDALEGWILETYPNTQNMLAPSETATVDRLARYIGETFRKALGGRWNIRVDDPSYAFYRVPELTGFAPKPTPICPLMLATASADRRTGRFIGGVLAAYVRGQAGSSR